MKRNPNWKEEELKLALALYWAHDLQWLSKMSDTTPDIIKLSYVLNSLDLFEEPKGDKFRSVGSIRMKLSNFKSLDTRYGKRSLPNIGQLDKEIWFRYLNRLGELKKDCFEIVSEHYKGSNATEYKEFFERITYDSINQYAYDNDLITIRKLRQQSELSRDQELIQKYNELIAFLENRINPVAQEQSEQGGINQVRVSDTYAKIGEHVRKSISKLIESNRITPEILNDFLSVEWSRNTLHLNHPFFKEILLNKDVRQQLRDNNGHIRYWKKIYDIEGKHYAICKEWYESNRKYFDAWYTSMNSDLRVSCSPLVFMKFLELVKYYDETEVCINIMKLKSDGKFKAEDVDSLVDYLTKQGVLIEFQGSARDFNIDDYDLFYKMLRYPDDYIQQ